MTVDSLKGLIEELNKSCASIDPSGTGIRPVITRLVIKYVTTVDLTPHGGGGYAYNYVNPTMKLHQNVLDTFEYCLALAVPEGCTKILNRFLNPAKLDLNYVTNYLVPFVPKYRELLVRLKQSLASPLFAPTFQGIMLHYLQTVLGPRPPDTASNLLNALQNWNCSCDGCTPVRTFLTREASREKTISRIGAPKRKHVESFLQRYAASICTWDTVRTTPQGLSVRMDHQCYSSLSPIFVGNVVGQKGELYL